MVGGIDFRVNVFQSSLKCNISPSSFIKLIHISRKLLMCKALGFIRQNISYLIAYSFRATKAFYVNVLMMVIAFEIYTH